ncbi:DUF4411 family protein [Arthrobacter frigidicola]|nr:DUF4411 family protein [Arthrobacter frigidicola]
MYIFDSNAFIAASRQHYGFDIAPGFWSWVCDGKLSGAASSSKWVKGEIDAGNRPLDEDLLKQWASVVRPDFWLDDSVGVASAMGELTAWVTDPSRIYSQQAQSDFLESVDYRIIAQAKAESAILVTSEVSAKDSVRRVKIPDAAEAIGVSCIDPFSAYRALGLKLLAA